MSSQSKILLLIAKLDTPRDTLAEEIIQKLENIGKPAVPYLLDSAQDEKAPRIRKWSLQALGAIGDIKGASVLMKALEHSQMTVKLHAIRGLARMKYKKAAKRIAKLLKDESGGIRVNAITSLIRLNDKSVAAEIVPVLEDSMWYVRQEACRACGHFKINKAKSKLLVLSKEDEKKAVRNAATEALKSLKAK